ncbi:Calx-beta domain-containing protein [Reyranella sp.]|uniref:Calx-beta domain-containing protein n=1 Tax=Reyranella sp. TaxID=1929291 RepID=UPI003D12B3FF
MSNGTFTQFLDALRAFESGVDYDRYLSGQITESQIRSWVGDANWNAYQAGQLSWHDMQYTSVNALGFVGYQFGEPLLIDLGYYQGNTGNLWTGHFTGKNGVDSFATLKTDIQEAIILDAFGYNLTVIESGLEAKGTSLDALIGTQRTYVDTNGQSVTVTLTLTGILAAAHLRGAWGTLDLLNNGSASADEYGTSILKYIQQFGAYDTPSYSTLIAAHESAKTLALAEELWHDDFNNDGTVADYAGWDGTQADGGSSGGQTGGGGGTGGDGAATVTTINWTWGLNTVLAFDPALDVLDFGWFQKDNFSIAEVGGSVVITITGNNQTYRLDGVTLAELSMDNIRAKDASVIQKWDTALDTAEPAVPSLSVADVSVKEGNSGIKLMTFTVILSAAAAGPVTVAYSTADGTATSGSDYVAASGTLTFAAGETSKTIEVTVKGDKVAESNETLTIRLANADGATIADGSATGTVTNDDATATLPALSVGDVSMREGDSGTAELMFIVTLDKAATGPVTVNYATADGTATAGSDYAALTGTLTFAAGETSKMVHVVVNGDTAVEAAETFSLTLSSATGATIADATAVGQITDDDTQQDPGNGTGRVWLINSVSGADIVGFDPALDKIDLGNANIHSFIIIDTPQGFGFMSPWSGETVIVQGVRLADLSVENFEYIDNNHLREALSGALAWENGPVLAADTVYMRSHEVGQVDRVDFDPATDVVSFKFYGSRENLSMTDSAEGVVIADLSTGQKLILLGVTRADLSPANFEFTFTQVREDDLSAKIGMGQASNTQIVDFNLPIAGGGTVTGASGATDGATGHEGHALPALSIADLSVAEGNGDHAHFMFTVTLDHAATSPVTVAYSTANGTAKAGKDYVASSGTVTFAAGETSKTVHVDIKGDVLAEANETFKINLSSPTGATIADGTATGTIIDDDRAPALPALSIADLSVAEGNGDHAHFMFVLTLDKAADGPVTVAYTTANGTAKAGKDYVASSGTVTFDAGETSKMVHVDIKGDVLAEGNETFKINLSSPTGATIADGTAIGTIIDDDGAAALPALSIADLSVAEGNGDHAHFMFVVTLDKAAAGPVTVAYSTANDTATAGSDYVASNGTLTFAAGETSKTVHVDISGDTVFEGNETFAVTLSNASGATIADATAVGTIVNDDSEPDQGHVGNGKADTFAITWAWGTNTAIDFDTALDTLDFNWMAKDDFSIAEVNGSTVITIEGNNQTYKLTDVSLAELSSANIAAKDASAVSEWAAALDAAHTAHHYDLMI